MRVVTISQHMAVAAGMNSGILGGSGGFGPKLPKGQALDHRAKGAPKPGAQGVAWIGTMIYGLATTLVLMLLAPAAGPRPPPVRSAEEFRSALARADGPRRLALLNELAETTAESSPAEAITLGEEAALLARAAGDGRAEAAALIAVAAARRARGEYLLGADSARTALALADKAADPLLAARAHNVLGLIESSRGEPAAALRHALLEQALFERAGDRRGLSQAYNNVANSLRRMGEYDRALDFHGRSLALKEERGDRDGAGYSHHNMGEVHLDAGAPEQALLVFRAAEREWRSVGNTRALPAAVKSQGQALEALGRNEEALERYRLSVALRADIVNPRGEAESLTSLAALLLRMGRAGDATVFYRKAAAISRQLGQKSLGAEVLGGLAAAEEASGDFGAARRARVEEIGLLHSLREEEHVRARADMRAALELHEMRSRAEGLERDAVLRNEDLRSRRAERNFALAGAAFLLAVALFSVAGYRAKRMSEARLRDEHVRLEDALAHVKTLRGLLPLCAWCKKVRNDEGYWRDLVDHVKEHTEAAITHGICPDCRAAVYSQTPKA
jgi:tetratricopeptide (TPR) repeat protein